MRIIKLFFLTFFSLNIFAQIPQKIQGDWIKYHSERVDGSTINDRFTKSNVFLEISITDSVYCVQFGPFVQKCLNYSLKKNTLSAGNYINYEIEMPSSDTLILSELSDIKPPNELNKIYFSRKAIYVSKVKKRIIEKDILVLTKENSPTYNGSLRDEISESLRRFDNSKFKGYIDFNHLNSTINTVITENNSKNDKTANHVKTKIDASYNRWKFNKINNVERMYFVCQTLNKDYFKSFNITPFTQEYYEPLSETERKKAQNYLNRGVKEYEKKNYDKAISFFTKSFNINKNLVEAIFNRSVIYYETNQLKKACEDWHYISQLSSKNYKVSDYIKEFCSK